MPRRCHIITRGASETTHRGNPMQHLLDMSLYVTGTRHARVEQLFREGNDRPNLGKGGLCGTARRKVAVGSSRKRRMKKKRINWFAKVRYPIHRDLNRSPLY